MHWYCPSLSEEKFEMLVDIRCPIRFECILSCSTNSGFCPANLQADIFWPNFFIPSLTDFRANLSSLIKASLIGELCAIILAGNID